MSMGVGGRHGAADHVTEGDRRLHRLLQAMAQGYAEGELLRDVSDAVVGWRVRLVNPALQRVPGWKTDAPWFLECVTRAVLRQRTERCQPYSTDAARWQCATCYPLGGDRFALLYDVVGQGPGEAALRQDERSRIARDIHDRLGQTLTALRINLEMIGLRAALHPALADAVERTLRVAEELDHGIELLTWNLSDDGTERLGLVPALRHLVSGWSVRFGVAAEVEAPDRLLIDLPPTVATNIYRLAQEALHNVAKHAHATRVRVIVTRAERELAVRIEDDGRGFEAGDPSGSRGGGHGLANMKERAALAGAQCQIESTPGGGTTVMVRLEIEPGF